MEKILITGADGFFASRFIDFYKTKYNIIPLNHNKLDITDEKRTIEVIKGYNPNYIIHAAALSDIAACEKNPELSYEVNVKGTINVAKACYILRKSMAFLSTDQVYLNCSAAPPFDEGIKVTPSTVYGKHKLEAEKTLLQIISDASILRLTWLFSLPERNKKIRSNIVWNIIKAVVNRETIKLSTNEYRGMTYIYDLLNNFDDIIHLPGGVYNAGSENNYSSYEIGEMAIREMGLSHKMNEIIIKDDSINQKKDIRIYNQKLVNCGINFDKTEKAIVKCINEFSYKF